MRSPETESATYAQVTPSSWRRFTAALPMRISLVAVGVVWLLGCAWSFQEQSAFAASKAFAFPHLLPLVIDGFAVSMAGVSWAASLDARAALPARVATLVAVGASSASNGAWAYLRAHHDPVTVVLGMAVPIAANMAFEVLLAELRRQVQRRRGLPAPVAIPYPRLIRLALAPSSTFRAWRQLVLQLTALEDPAVIRPTAPTVSRSGHRTAAIAAKQTEPEHDRGPGGSPVPAPSALRPSPAVLPAPPTSPAPAAGGASAESPIPDRAATVGRKSVPSLVPSLSVPSASKRPAARPVDPRAVALAQRLATMDEADTVTGPRVGPLLGLDIAPRTGQRLLGQARQLLKDEQHRPTRLSQQHRFTASR